jgi:hypothetical protein
MINEEERKFINTIIYRTNVEVIKTMKKIPKEQFFSWKFEEKEDDKTK